MIEKNTMLTTQARKRASYSALQEHEQDDRSKSKRSNKRLKITEPSSEDADAKRDKENLMQALIRRSSCIFGFRKDSANPPPVKKAMQSIEEKTSEAAEKVN